MSGLKTLQHGSGLTEMTEFEATAAPVLQLRSLKSRGIETTAPRECRGTRGAKFAWGVAHGYSRGWWRESPSRLQKSPHGRAPASDRIAATPGRDAAGAHHAPPGKAR